MFRLWNFNNLTFVPLFLQFKTLIYDWDIYYDTDRFKSNGREESINHKVDLLSQVRHTEVLQQSFFTPQTIDEHTEAQPTCKHTHILSSTRSHKQNPLS